MRYPVLVAGALLAPALLFASAPIGLVHGEEPDPAIAAAAVEYPAGDVTAEGWLAHDRTKEGKRPGVLVFHAWKGIGDHERTTARDLAKAGYVALCADVYGKGVRPTENAEAAKVAGRYKGDRALVRERAKAALEVLRKDPRVDPERVAAVGYCFGGMCALELARSGADVDAVVSFHGSLGSPTPEDAKNVKGKVLVLHGADDPNVKPAEVSAWMEEMRAGGVDWSFTAYGGAVHSFTDPGAGSDPSKGAAYHERSARRAWEAANDLLAEALGGR